MGYQALAGVSGSTTGERNTALGGKAGKGFTTGANNLFLGYLAGDSLTTGSSNILIGYDADMADPTASYYLNIGNTLYGTLTGGGDPKIGETGSSSKCNCT